MPRHAPDIDDSWNYSAEAAPFYDGNGYRIYEKFLSDDGLATCRREIDRMLDYLQPGRDPADVISPHVIDRWIWDLAHDRETSTAEMMERVDNGPYLAEEAVTAGLIEEAIHADELEDSLEDLFGRPVKLDRGYSKRVAPRPGSPQRYVRRKRPTRSGSGYSENFVIASY